MRGKRAVDEKKVEFSKIASSNTDKLKHVTITFITGYEFKIIDNDYRLGERNEQKEFKKVCEI